MPRLCDRVGCVRRAGLLVFFLLFLLLSASLAQAEEPEVTADAAILIDAQTGRVLWSKHGEERHYPASMTKMMTCLLGMNSLTPDSLVKISPLAAQTEDTPLQIAAGDTMRFEEILRGMMMASDNGAAVAIAEAADGSVPDFVARMNEKAAELGMTGTHFANPNGLTDEDHYSTPHDMARLAQYAMRNPVFRDIVRQQQRTIRWEEPAGKQLLVENTNELLGRYEGITGIKTGWTKAAGGCLAASAERGDVRLIAVVMHAASEEDRFKDMRRILDYGFAETTMAAGPTASACKRHVWVKGGVHSRTKVVPAGDIYYPLLPGESAEHYTISYDLPKVIAAPIEPGEAVGKLILSYDGQPVGSVDLIANPVEPGFSLGSWLVGVFEGVLTWL